MNENGPKSNLCLVAQHVENVNVHNFVTNEDRKLKFCMYAYFIMYFHHLRYLHTLTLRDECNQLSEYWSI